MARIIVADDELGLQRIYFYMLDSLGHDAVICCNGEEAVNAFRANGADLVILDITMPVMDGLEACRQIKQLPEGTNVPVVIVSAIDSEREISAGFNAGADDYMLKPIRENILIAKLKNFLKTSSLHRREFDLVRNRVVFLDRYRISKVIGYGAHSVVFLAEDIRENKPVAVKLLNENISDAATQRCFVELVAKFKEIDSSRVVKIYDYGVYGGQLYMVMEYAEAGNLRQKVTVKHLDELETSKLAIDMLEAIMAMEQRDLLHLDIKPENILINEGVYKLTDFGMALERTPGTIPLRTEIWGTAAYVCPEYLEETASLNIKSDIYSLGVTLFEVMVGDNPFFSGQSTVSMFRQVNMIPPYLANLLNEKCSFEFSDVIAGMMCKNPADRPDLETLYDWFSYFVSCYEQGTEKEELHYPRPEQKKAMIATQETTLRKRRAIIKLEPKKKGKLGSAIDRAGNAVFHSVMMRENKRMEKLQALTGQLGMIVLILIFFGLIGYSVLPSIRYRAGSAENIPAVNVMCQKCGFIEDRKIKIVEKYSCSKCGGALGYPCKCNNCGTVFCWMRPNFPRGSTNLQKNKILIDISKCPKCSSSDIEFILKQRKGAKKKK